MARHGSSPGTQKTDRIASTNPDAAAWERLNIPQKKTEMRQHLTIIHTSKVDSF